MAKRKTRSTKKKASPVGLIYTGGGFLPGIPAKDLTPEQAEQYGRELLIESGLYTEDTSGAVLEQKESGNDEEE